MYRFFQSFLETMKSAFQRIARATKHETSVDELHSDAWIAAREIGERRGREIDFSDPADQKLIIGAVGVRNVQRPEKHMRYASRIDQTYEDGEGEVNPWAHRLQAAETSDPLVDLLLRESAIDAEDRLSASYSQAAAYVMVFVHFKNNRQAVCAYLVVSEGVLARRVNFADDTVRVQPSLFDRIERIGEDFMPLPGKRYAVRAEQSRSATQWAWEF